MFALQVTFIDAAQPELIFIRRQQAVVGGDDSAHVVIDDMRPLSYQIKIIRQIGRNFVLEEMGKEGSSPSLALDSVYEGFADLDLGPVKLSFVALDVDLSVKEGEALDKASVRVARIALSLAGPRLPAIVTRGSPPCVVSIFEQQPYLIGRSRAAAIRLESADISAKHARVSFEDDQFWVEDLGSTNGTFVNGQRVAGKTPVDSMTPIVLGRELSILGIVSEANLQQLLVDSGHEIQVQAPHANYPCVLSLSSVVRPSRLPLTDGMQLHIGREAKSDIWLGAPHVSREHCEIAVEKNAVLITDTSTNGTGYDEGLLRRGEEIRTTGRPYVLNFGAGVTLAICFSAEHEAIFRESEGSPTSFSSSSTQKTDTKTEDEVLNEKGTVFQPIQALKYTEKPSFLKTARKAFSEVPRSVKFVLVAVGIGLLTLIAAILALLLSAWIR